MLEVNGSDPFEAVNQFVDKAIDYLNISNDIREILRKPWRDSALLLSMLIQRVSSWASKEGVLNGTRFVWPHSAMASSHTREVEPGCFMQFRRV